MKKRRHSEETKAKIAAANRGSKRSFDVKIKMSLARRAMLKRRNGPWGIIR